MTDGISYQSDFYHMVAQGADSSAAFVVPEICKLIQVNSVVDVGCGTGAWLRAFQNEGVQQIHGFDGPWVDNQTLLIPRTSFAVHDLTMPLDCAGQFDLVLSLEVAEHLPESAADIFINTLTSLSDVIVFSAAIPYQGGENHLNEQWPSYWAQKFIERGYVGYDVFRLQFWNNTNVAWCYSQNMFLYVSATHELRQSLPYQTIDIPENARALVHPLKYLEITQNSITHRISYAATNALKPHISVAHRQKLRSVQRSVGSVRT